jgi:hypothetical protein
MNSLIVGVAIGLVFLFALFAALTSMLTEAVAWFLGLRGAFLLRGIRALVDGQTSGMPQVSALGRIWALGRAGGGAAEAAPPSVGAAADCGGRDPADCLREVRGEIEELRTVGLPLGWPADPLCEQAGGTAEAGDDCSFFERFGLADRAGNGLADARYLLVLLVGYTLMVLALVPGARFWFDLLGRLGSLRSSGPKPARS